MRKVITSIVFAVLLLPLTATAQKTYALLLGVQEYDNPEFDISNLQNTSKDAKALKKVFDKAGVTSALLTGNYVSRETVEKKLTQLAELTRRHPDKDDVIFFFSGHGTDGAMCFWDGKYSYADLFERLASIRARNVFVFIDACHSGTGGQLMMGAPVSKVHPRMAFISATRSDESSIDDSFQILTHGWFTQALIKGLRGLGDSNSDKQVTLIELYNYVYNDVTARCSRYRMVSDGKVNVFHPQLFAPGSIHDEKILKW